MAITAPSGRFPPAWVPAAIALAWIGALAAAGDLGAPAYALPLLAAGAAVPAFVLFKATQGRPYAIATVFALVLILLDAKFTIPREPFQPTWQAGLKVAVWATVIGIAGARWHRIAPLLIRPEIILLLGYVTIALVSALWSVVPAFSGGAGLGLLAYVALACIVVIDLRDETAVRVIVWALLAFVCAGIVSAAVVPDLAWMNASLEEAGAPDRLQGFASHPNVLGQFAGILMLMVVTARRQALVGRATFYGGLAIGVVTILATGSRTALIAVLVACGLVTARNSRLGAAAAVAMVGVLSLVLILAGCGGGGSTPDDSAESQPAPPVVMAVTAARVRIAPMRAELRLLGTTVAMRHITLRAPAAGRVMGLELQSGDRVITTGANLLKDGQPVEVLQ